MNDETTPPPEPPPAQPPAAEPPPAEPPPAEPQAPAAPPPAAAAPPAPRSESAGAPMRLLVILLAVVLGFAGAVMFVVGLDVNDLASCENPAEVIASGESECFDGSEGIKPVVVGLSIASGVVAGIGLIVGIFFAVTGTRGRLFAQLAGAAVILAVLAFILG